MDSVVEDSSENARMATYYEEVLSQRTPLQAARFDSMKGSFDRAVTFASNRHGYAQGDSNFLSLARIGNAHSGKTHKNLHDSG
jgi:hypothetical protein